MNFKTYLLESVSDGKYKTIIDESTAIDLLNKHCKNMDFNKPYWRGMSNDNKYYILEGALGERKSVGSSNHYTVLIDDLLKKEDKNFPLRAKSIICANNYNLNTAIQYGAKVYAIFPYDDAIIGMTEKEDIWFTYVKLGKFNTTINDINDMLQHAGIKATNLNDIVNQVESLFDEKPRSLDYIQKKLIKRFDSKEAVRESFETAYNYKNLGITFGKTTVINEIHSAHEIWFSGKCIAIDYHIFKELQKNKFKIGQ